LLIGFLLFRLFDIVKPFPIRRLEKVPLGFGIVLDDLAAGFYASLVLRILDIWWPNLTLGES
jgi:phosphatidylglycerophosphatase A